MILNPIGSGLSGIESDSSANGVKYTHDTTHSEPQGVQTTLSTDVASIKALAAHAMQGSKSSDARVEALRTAVSLGSYSLDPSAIASALFRHYAG